MITDAAAVVKWLSVLFGANFLIHISLDSYETYPLNLSISISGGKETNLDSLSSGERRGRSS